LFIQGDR